MLAVFKGVFIGQREMGMEVRSMRGWVTTGGRQQNVVGGRWSDRNDIAGRRRSPRLGLRGLFSPRFVVFAVSPVTQSC